MSNFLDCMQKSLRGGLTTRERMDNTQDAWQRASDEYSQRYDRRTAQEMAYQDVLEALKGDTARRRHQKLAALRVMRAQRAEVSNAKELHKLGLAKMESLSGRQDQVESVRFKQDAITAEAMGMMSSLFTQIFPNITGGIGAMKRATMEKIGRELRGEDTGNASAKAMAEAINKTNEWLRQRANEAGFHIEKLEDWGFRQMHNWRKIDEAGVEGFIEVYAPELRNPGAKARLDWTRIENYATGRPFSEASAAAKESFLRDVFESGTRSIYAPVVEPRYGPPVFGDNQADRYAHQRILHFNSFDDFKAVNDAFDGPDLFTLITGHVRSMGRDIALVEAFGPNIRYGLEHYLQAIRVEANKRDLARGDGKKTELRRVLSREPTARAMQDQLSGLAGTPEGPNQAVVANFFSNVRGYLNISLLGSAVLSSAGDFASTRMVAHAMKINPRNVFAEYTKFMAQGMTRTDALRGAHVAESLSSYGAGMARFQSEVPGSELISRGVDTIMRAQGLTRHTEALRMSVRFGIEGAMAEASEKGMKLADMPDYWQRRLTQRGITEDDWAALIDPRFQFTAANGAKFVNPHYWRQVTDMEPTRRDRIVTTMVGFIEEGTERSVPTRSVLGDAVITQGSRPGTLLGEVTRSGKHLKSFAINMLLHQYGTFMEQPTMASRAQYLAMFAVWFGFMGAAAVQIKEIAKGNDPRPMDTVSFWGAASLQGGGFGVVGDLLTASETRLGGGLGGWLAGPVVGLTEDFLQLTAGNLLEAARGDNTNLGREIARTIGDKVPFQSYFPFRTAWDRMVAEQVQLFLDPEASRSLRTSAANQLRDYGNESFWERGEMLPSRGPDLGNALGM